MECNKRAYNSYREAQTIINAAKSPKWYSQGKRVKRRSRKNIIPIRSYKCEFCNKWHLTSKFLKKHAS